MPARVQRAAPAQRIRTTNFLISAPDVQTAQQVGHYAEAARKEKAILWLGKEMAAWPQPCTLVVKIAAEDGGGSTSFAFGPTGVQGMTMQVNGRLDRLIACTLPHEVTHTVFAVHFGCPLPRWADEGGAGLSEDVSEYKRHDRVTRDLLNAGQQIPLRQLFTMREYPRDSQGIMSLYSQGFSVANYLVRGADHRTFLAFVGQGMRSGWDQAATSNYGFMNVEELEESWKKHLRETKNQADSITTADRCCPILPWRRKIQGQIGGLKTQPQQTQPVATVNPAPFSPAAPPGATTDNGLADILAQLAALKSQVAGAVPGNPGLAGPPGKDGAPGAPGPRGPVGPPGPSVDIASLQAQLEQLRLTVSTLAQAPGALRVRVVPK